MSTLGVDEQEAKLGGAASPQVDCAKATSEAVLLGSNNRPSAVRPADLKCRSCGAPKSGPRPPRLLEPTDAPVRLRVTAASLGRHCRKGEPQTSPTHSVGTGFGGRVGGDGGAGGGADGGYGDEQIPFAMFERPAKSRLRPAAAQHLIE
eukprot:2518612-Prymnesium_polylepis.1